MNQNLQTTLEELFRPYGEQVLLDVREIGPGFIVFRLPDGPTYLNDWGAAFDETKWALSPTAGEEDACVEEAAQETMVRPAVNGWRYYAQPLGDFSRVDRFAEHMRQVVIPAGDVTYHDTLVELPNISTPRPS